jgi:hypothetical protein
MVLTLFSGWCFYINLPLGAVTFLTIFFYLRLSPPPVSSSLLGLTQDLDLPGTLLFIPSIVSLLLALQWAGGLFPWNSWRIILLLCVFGVSFTAWCFYQYCRGDLATVPPRIITQRSIAFGLLHITTAGAAAFVLVYYISIWFQSVKNYSPQQSGINYLAISVGGAVFPFISGLMVST